LFLLTFAALSVSGEYAKSFDVDNSREKLLYLSKWNARSACEEQNANVFSASQKKFSQLFFLYSKKELNLRQPQPISYPVFKKLLVTEIAMATISKRSEMVFR
jgi:hypothetical protein